VQGHSSGSIDRSEHFGGTATGGDLNIPGMPGIATQPGSPSGAGGSTMFGGGGTPWQAGPGSQPGNPGTGFGSGGGGGHKNGPASPGGTGAPGVVIIEEFF